MTDRLISEQAVMESLTKEYNQKRTGDGLKLAWIEKAVSATPTASDWDRYSTKLWKEAYERGKRDAQPEVAKDINVPTNDLISRQAAIESAESCCRVYGDDAGYRIVEELRELPTVQPTQANTLKALETLDCVSRQAAIDEVSRWRGYLDDDMINRIQIGMKRLPSAQPENKTGHWENVDIKMDWGNLFPVKCSECGARHQIGYDFCPSCGADMRED